MLGDREVWLTAARKVFDGIGDDCESGRISSEHLIGMLRTKLPAEEVESAVEAAMIDAGYAGDPTLARHLLYKLCSHIWVSAADKALCTCMLQLVVLSSGLVGEEALRA